MKPKTHFFSRKTMLLICSAVFLFIVMVNAGSYIIETKKIRDLKAIQARDKAAFENLSKKQQAIRNGENYLVGSIHVVKPTNRLFIAYLQRKFNLHNSLGIDGPPINLYEDPISYPQEIHYLARIAYPERIVNVPSKSKLDGATLTNVYSANCDHMSEPASFWPTIRESINQGGYNMAHVALALSFMKDNGCKLPSDALEIEEAVVSGLIGLAAEKNTLADLRYESIAFLFLLGRDAQVEPDWITQITAEQNKDGGWSQTVGGGLSDEHATLLALWSLLEAERPQANEPLIRRP